MAQPKAKRPFDLGKKGDFSKQMYTMPSRTAAAKPPTVTISKAPIAPSSRPSSQLKFAKDGLPKTNGAGRKNLTPSRSTSRQTSSEPREARKSIRSARSNRSSPAEHTTRWGNDEDDDDEASARRKRPRVDEKAVDKARRIRDPTAFVDSDDAPEYDIVHAADIANPDTRQHGRYVFEPYYNVLGADEEEAPTIELQYPCANMTERYQLVKPTDQTDFKPLSEIQDVMKNVSKHYLDDEGARVVYPDDFGGGLVGKLQKWGKDSTRPGAQKAFIDIVQQYNRLLSTKRAQGTISSRLNTMLSPLPSELVNHIIKEQIYSRTVSPRIEIVRQYTSFSDNVYGELLPKFLSQIFKETNLKSNQVFVDLGSGVGNCVLQAALEIGCESWGCESMDNPSRLAALQAREFSSRCRMWGIEPGKVHLIHDDFTTNRDIGEALKKADVVLVNNQAFTPILNDTLKSIFLDLKEGCQIVSLKYFRSPAHEVKESNINDIVNGLQVIEKERFSKMVSWSDDPGKWYLHVKDSTELKAVKSRILENGGSL